MQAPAAPASGINVLPAGLVGPVHHSSLLLLTCCCLAAAAAEVVVLLTAR